MATAAKSSSTTSIPTEYQPYFTDMLGRAQTESLTPYTTYGGPRLATNNADVMGSHEMVRNMATQGMPGTQEAMDMTRNAAAGIGAFANANPYQYSQFGYSGPGTFDAASANQYMNPFVQNVLGQQNEQAARDYQTQNATRTASAVQAGAFGGSRQAVQQGMAENDLLNRQNLTQATGLRDAYSDAQKMFETDRQARMTNERDRAAELSRVQAGQSSENLSRDRLGLEGLKFQNESASQLSTLEQRARAGDVEAAKLLEAAGKQEMGMEQAGYDLGYQDFIDQRDYNQNQINDYSNILQGLPLAGAGTVTGSSTPAQGSLLQQGLGLGIAAIGGYNSLFG